LFLILSPRIAQRSNLNEEDVADVGLKGDFDAGGDGAAENEGAIEESVRALPSREGVSKRRVSSLSNFLNLGSWLR